MAKIRPVTLTSLMLCYQIIFMHTSALDITLFSPKTSIKAAIGEELHITCLASKCSNKDPGFTWSPVTDNYLGGNVVTVDQKSTLSMEVRAETDGTYRCTVSCDNAPAEKSFTITVYSFPSDPVLHVSSLAVGQPSRITCVFPNVYPAEWLTAQILMNDIPVATYEPEENENEILNISLTHDVLLAEEMDESTILCSARLEFPDSDAEPLQRHKTQKLHLMYPPVKPQIIVQPSTMVKAGEEIRLLCSSDSKSHVIQWVKQIGDVEYEMSADDQGSLILSNAEPENSGVYICYAQNSVGKTFSQVEINVRGPPENPMLSLTPRTTVSAGEAVTIECIARSDANVTLWKISEDGEMFFLDSAGKVVIDEADPIDAAVYKCTAENQYGVSEASESLTVEYPPRETILSSSPIDVNEGDMVVLTCISQGVPTPTISISKLLPTGESVLLSEDSVIALAKVTGGIYQCQATNRLGSEKHKLELNVRAAPQNTQISITPSSVVREGDNVHIRCTSEASPAPRLALKMKMEHDVVDLVAEDGEYIISSAEERHIGIYICESTNVVGTEIVEAVLNVQVPPKNTYITISPSEVVREGDIVQIWCSSEGSPDPKLVLKMKTEDELLSLESSDGFYNISHAEIENAGTYICESTNVLGLEVALNTLTVQIPPRNTTVVVTPSQNIIEGDTVTITCETHSIPSPTIILQKICDQNNTVLQTQNGTFTLHNVTRNDTGTYKIKIFNSAGNETEVINIVVAERQQDPRFNPMSTIIFGSVAFVSVGVIGSIIYHLKKAKLQGSYSLVEALRSKV